MDQPIKNYRFLLPLGLMLLSSVAAFADDGKEVFEQKCASCHTLGGGDGAGPDLKGVVGKRSPEWLQRVITAPEKLTAEQDPTQAELVKKYGMEMPNVGASAEDATKIIAYLKEAGGGNAAAGAPASAAAQPAAPAPELTPAMAKELSAKGAALFSGKVAFAKGGPPCVACHGLNYPGIHGGALAADLTGMYAKMGEKGVRGVLKGLNFPVMKKAYADRPLTEEEAAALTALFKEASANKTQSQDPYPAAGLGFFGICLVAAALYKRRIR